MRKPKIRNVRHIKPFYVVSDFSEMFEMSRLGTRKMLYRINLPFVYVGRRMIFYLSDIRTHSPALFASILEANQLNELIQLETKEDLSDQEAFSKGQFEERNGSDW